MFISPHYFPIFESFFVFFSILFHTVSIVLTFYFLLTFFYVE